MGRKGRDREAPSASDRIREGAAAIRDPAQTRDQLVQLFLWKPLTPEVPELPARPQGRGKDISRYEFPFLNPPVAVETPSPADL